MASALENKRYTRNVPITTPAAPEALTRIGTQVARFGLSREHLSSQRNIWQTPPNFSGHGFGDDRRDVSSSADGRTAKPVGPALPRHYTTNAAATANVGKHDFHPTIGSSRAITRPPHTNTKPDPNGTLYVNGNPTMSGSRNLSLLPGSAPDDILRNSVASGYGDRRNPVNSKALCNLDFEGVEDFVPSYLRDRLDVHAQRNGDGPSRRAHFRKTQPQWTLNGSDRFYSHSEMQERDSIPNDSFGLNPAKHAFEFSAEAYDAASRGIIPAIPHFSDNLFPSIAAESASQTWDLPSELGNINLNADGSFPRTESNLRPEVAIYQPIPYTTNDPNNTYYTLDAHRGLHMEEFLVSDRDSVRSKASKGILPETNSHAFATNGSRGSIQDTSHWIRTLQESSVTSSAMPAADLDRTAAHNERVLNRPGRAETMQSRSRYFDKQQQSPYTSEYSNRLYYPPSHYNSVYADPQALSHHISQSTESIADTHHFAPDGIAEEVTADYQAERSSLLQEFAATYKQKKWEIKDIKHHVVEFCGDSNGSRWIQEKLDHATLEEKEQIWSEILTNVRQLMNDTYGNYVIQKLFDHGTQSQKRMLGNHMKNCMFFLSMQTYGCRVVQKAFEHILTDQQASLVKELEGHVIKVVESQHGNHVIQKAIETIPAEHIQFIVDAHKHQVIRLARHTYGCRVIQRILEHCTPQAKQPILDELHCAIPVLIDDPFGNYVIQNIITKGNPHDRQRVVGFVQQRLLYYSTHKFASNVVEKAIEHADDHQRIDMLRQLTSGDPNNFMSTPVRDLIKDQYGNYVMQTVLKRIQGPAKRRLVDEVRHHLYILGNSGHSKQVTAMSKTLNDVTASHSPSSASTSPQTPHTPMSPRSGGISMVPNKNAVELMLPGQGLLLPARPGHN